MGKKYPWNGCGTQKDITGCRFSLSPMCDNFIPLILGAIEKVDTKKIWSATDALSTVYRGKRVHVMDCVKACFAQINDGKTHITMEATVSKGCPGDTDGDSHLAEDDIPLNNSQKKFDVLCKIAFYPLGVADYIDHIAHIVNTAIDRGLYAESSHYATVLKGDVNDLFDYFDAALTYAEQNISHYVLQITLSVNSPTNCKNQEV
jgi:uncharacterized protein YqgV (UPF0045/DUF77 family)